HGSLLLLNQLERINYGTFKKFNDVCLSTLKEYHAGVQPAGVNVSHTWHSKNPIAGKYGHNHSFWLNYAFDKKAGKFVKVDKFYDVERLKEIYRKTLASSYGIDLEVVNLFIKYAHVDPENEEKRRKVLHMLSYAFRMPQKDITEYARGVKWNRKQLKYNQVRNPMRMFTQDEKDHISYILAPPPNWRRVRWYGWLADGVRAKYLKMLDIAIADTLEPPDDETERDVLCPSCGEKCVPLMNNGTNDISIESALKRYGDIFLPWDPGGNE
ncbi:unnamed protein product, partial [marine sediment metagenome]